MELNRIAATAAAAAIALSIAACGSGGTHWTQANRPSASTVSQSIVGATANDGTTVESADTSFDGYTGAAWAHGDGLPERRCISACIADFL
jgi:hypothetical protein